VRPGRTVLGAVDLGHAKVRYRGLAKNTARLTMMFALTNLWMVRRQLL
jgi:IS5 family transposase